MERRGRWNCGRFRWTGLRKEDDRGGATRDWESGSGYTRKEFEERDERGVL